jgi:hypothetical protein
VSAEGSKKKWIDADDRKIEDSLSQIVDSFLVNHVVEGEHEAQRQIDEARRALLARRRKLVELRIKREENRLKFLHTLAEARQEVTDLKATIGFAPLALQRHTAQAWSSTVRSVFFYPVTEEPADCYPQPTGGFAMEQIGTYWDTTWEWTKSVLAVLGLSGITIGSAVAVAYGLFKWLGEKWIDQKFEKQMESYKTEQSRELERLRHRIIAVFDRTIRLHGKEYEVLPDLWGRSWRRMAGQRTTWPFTGFIPTWEEWMRRSFLRPSSARRRNGTSSLRPTDR